MSLNITYDDLIMPPDMLRNRYALCGSSLLHSPQYQLIKDISAGKLKPDSEYLSRCRRGTLDGRWPMNLAPGALLRKCRQREEELLKRQMMKVYVLEMRLNGRLKYMMADGKHGAALVAFHNRPEFLQMQFISKSYAQDPFFRQIYDYTMSLSFEEYSINQKMIRIIQDER